MFIHTHIYNLTEGLAHLAFLFECHADAYVPVVVHSGWSRVQTSLMHYRKR